MSVVKPEPRGLTSGGARRDVEGQRSSFRVESFVGSGLLGKASWVQRLEVLGSWFGLHLGLVERLFCLYTKLAHGVVYVWSCFAFIPPRRNPIVIRPSHKGGF